MAHNLIRLKNMTAILYGDYCPSIDSNIDQVDFIKNFPSWNSASSVNSWSHVKVLCLCSNSKKKIRYFLNPLSTLFLSDFPHQHNDKLLIFPRIFLSTASFLISCFSCVYISIDLVANFCVSSFFCSEKSRESKRRLNVEKRIVV